ncbi:MAG: carboxypeptidase regulatory-like domain-containing protein, partial [Planctomycetota bacterium]
MNRVLLLALAAFVAAGIAALAWFALRPPAAGPEDAEPVAADSARDPAPRAEPVELRESAAPPPAADADALDGRRTATPAPAATSVQSLSGRVMSPSAPLAGAEVVLSAADGSELARARSDAGGQFFLALDAPVENAALLVRAKGYAPAGRIGERVERGQRRNLGLLRLEPGAELSGRVLDANGAPVAGATVELYAPVLAGLPNRAITDARTDRDGRFALTDAPSIELRIEARAAGHGARALDPVQAPTTDLELRLVEERTFRARFVDAATRT